MGEFMKIMMQIFITFLLASSAFASPDEALYIVPTPPELVKHSRFEIEIIEPFEGYHTQQISYIFPEILVGEANRRVVLQRVAGTPNSWESAEMRAECDVTVEIFSCNIYLKKPQARSVLSELFLPTLWADGLLSLDKSLKHLSSMGLTAAETASFSAVVGEFFSNEPAGILLYRL